MKSVATSTAGVPRTLAEEYFYDLQETLCRELATADGKGTFAEDRWVHREGGGGRTRVLHHGGVFEKAGVNASAVTATLSERLAERMQTSPQRVFATGVSLVLHPQSPMVPTVHANFRYLELENGDAWFGGGADLTPYYLFEDDARHFHRTWKRACDRHDLSHYPKFKNWCDEYFTVRHRNETRGIGGIFFDHVRGDFEKNFAFVKECGNSFLEAYVPLVDRRREEPWGDRERQWQVMRRGRYVEFNLVYDRGTLFGLETGGRTESILMSLPPLVSWADNISPEPGSREEQLTTVLAHPREWIDPGT